MAQVDAQELEIVFIDAAPPPLPAGDFQINVSQAISWEGGSTDPFGADYDFTVAGPRFTLDPALVHGMFPPPGTRGHYHKYLPHVVFSRRSIPWERTIDNSLPTSKPFTPWLYVLSLDQAEIEAHEIGPQTVTVADVITPPEGVLGPDIQMQTGDDPASQCMVLDVPVALINTLMPTKDDLTLMAGAREVSVMAKEITPATEDGFFSTVVGNRFPANGQANTQFLVSLEGYGTNTTNILYPNQVDPAQYHAVRLVLMLSWTFTNVDDDQTFSQLMRNLSVDSLQLPNKSENETVNEAFSRGYTALNHLTRQGEGTVSWYRGPFLPVDMPENPPPAYPNYNFPNGDAALRFDPQYAMFDVCYAAAWQTGRLLGLQNGEFAAAIARFRDNNISTMHTLSSRGFMHRRLSAFMEMPNHFRDLLGRQVFDKAVGEWWGRDLGPKFLPDSNRPDGPLLGLPADPSGLRSQLGKLSGLLEPHQIQRLISDFERDGDPADLMQRILRLIFDQGAE